MTRHLIGAKLTQISPEHAVVEAIEDEQQADVHPALGCCTEQEIDAAERHHHNDISADVEIKRMSSCQRTQLTRKFLNHS